MDWVKDSSGSLIFHLEVVIVVCLKTINLGFYVSFDFLDSFIT